MIQHPLSGMHVVLIKTAGGRKAGVCYISKYFRAAWTKLYKNDPNADPAEADYVIKAGFPETTCIIVAKVPTLTLTLTIDKNAKRE